MADFKNLSARVLARLWLLTKLFAGELLRSARLFPRMVAKPAVALFWLARSHVAQLILVLSLIFMPQIVPNLADQVLAYLYRPVSTKLLGVIPITTSNPKLRARQAQARLVLWYGSGAAVLLAFWFSIPAALARGERAASGREEEADGLLDSSPSKSVVLYRSALGFATGPAHIAALKEKLEALDRRVRDVTEAGAEAGAGDTVVMKVSSSAPSISQRYETVEELGRGAMGVVLLAMDTVLEREVAIKELPHYIANDPQLFERFRREAKMLARLNHPGIVQVYDFSEFDGSAWIVMEYVKGEELEQRVARAKVLAPLEVVRLAGKMAEALEYAHAQGVLHRDLKPANVMIDEQRQPKIMDFGVARLVLSGSQTQPGTILGSPAYMSPEQALGKEVDVRSDVYALGATLYKLLSGAPLFEGTAAEVIAQVIHQTPRPIDEIVPGLPAQLSALVTAAVCKEPGGRPASMTEVKKALSLCELNG